MEMDYYAGPGIASASDAAAADINLAGLVGAIKMARKIARKIATKFCRLPVEPHIGFGPPGRV